jgi:DNA invertase Pin-like site-specific DNA recombinase
MRAVIYARVSRPDQTIAMQLDEGRELATRRGWTLAATYEDEGISSTKTSRPALDRMLEDARRRRFDVLIVWRTDRIFRSLSHMVRTLEEFRAWGIDFVSVREPFDTCTPHGKLLFHLSAAFAEYERAIIVERSIAGVAAARRRGTRIGRPRVFVDVARARKMMRPGVSMQEIANALRVPRTTLARKLRGELVKIGPYRMRACCGAQPGAPCFPACRGVDKPLALPRPKVPPRAARGKSTKRRRS